MSPGEEEDLPACLTSRQRRADKKEEGSAAALQVLQVPVFSQKTAFQQASHLQ